jgi:hypothetical protein
VVDVSDALRASIVLGVSALDHFVHEVARRGMLETARGHRPPTGAYLRFQVSLRGVAEGSQSGGLDWLDQEIRARHGWQTFQDPDKIADVLRCVTDKPLWRDVGVHLGLGASDAKARLRLIVDRRNKIAHEADVDPTSPGCRWPISATVVAEALAFLDRLGVAIAAVAAT